MQTESEAKKQIKKNNNLINLKDNQCSKKDQILKLNVVVLVSCVKYGILWVLHEHVLLWILLVYGYILSCSFMFKVK